MRLRRSIARRGLIGTVRLVVWHGGEPARRAVLALRERRFEAQYGVDTGGYLPPPRESLHGDSTEYRPTQPDRLHRLFALLRTDPGPLTFIDLGCGKGKALILAAEAGFGRIVGVELDPILAGVARKNLVSRGISGEVHEMDAARFAFPRDPVFVYLFNPFGEETLRAVLAALRQSHSDHRRPVFLAYDNAVHRDIVLEESFLSVIGGGEHWTLFGAT